jgi:hypothetical protein
MLTLYKLCKTRPSESDLLKLEDALSELLSRSILFIIESLRGSNAVKGVCVYSEVCAPCARCPSSLLPLAWRFVSDGGDSDDDNDDNDDNGDNDDDTTKLDLIRCCKLLFIVTEGMYCVVNMGNINSVNNIMVCFIFI